jgi:hypothetical protein
MRTVLLGPPLPDDLMHTFATPEELPPPPPESANSYVYDLRVKGNTSERFNDEVGCFSARVMSEIERRGAHSLDGYRNHVTNVLGEEARSQGEYGLELLTIGMMVRVYGELAARTPGWVVYVARQLYSLRRRSPGMKRLADFLRAGIFQLFMRRKGDLHEPHIVGAKGTTDFNRLARVVSWLRATGEFEQEWRRMENWRGYWSGLPAAYARTELALATDLFDWFEQEAERALGKYTAGVMPFLKKDYARRFWREDQIFCGRLPVEYHLGMVAAEVMNRGLREEFQSRRRKVVLVPACMRGARAETCKAVTRELDITCAGCDPECAVNRITRRMRHEGIQVYIVPHSSGFSRWLERWQNDSTVGVAAVACMMNILAGGYEMRSRRIASQCVPLDFPGCEKHWKSEPVATSVDEERLVQIVTRPA